ncbi:MAG: glycosyltransferase [Candidatus Riflebacteria bacterium]|nr:glycosyltransferase [Candidatus Riflebacteria bacterium]
MKKVLLLSDNESVTVQMTFRMLHLMKKYGFSYSFSIGSDLSKINSDFDIPLLVRSVRPYNLYWLYFFKSNKIPYIYYIDDSYWKLSSQGYFKNNALLETLNELIGNAWMVIVNSRILMEEVLSYNKNVVVLPAFYDFSILKDVIREKHENEIRIGYPSVRSLDIEPLFPTIKEVLDRFPGKVFFEFFLEVPDYLKNCNGVRTFKPIVNYEDFARFQFSRGWDIGLATLRDLGSNQAKTNNKYREFGACGTAGIYSKLPTYSDFVVHNKTGILIDNTKKSWFDSMVKLIESPSMVRQIGENAYQDVKEKFSLDVVLPQWCEVLNSVPDRRKLHSLKVDFPLRLKVAVFFAFIRYGLSGLCDKLKKGEKIFNKILPWMVRAGKKYIIGKNPSE